MIAQHGVLYGYYEVPNYRIILIKPYFLIAQKKLEMRMRLPNQTRPSPTSSEESETRLIQFPIIATSFLSPFTVSDIQIKLRQYPLIKFSPATTCLKITALSLSPLLSLIIIIGS